MWNVSGTKIQMAEGDFGIRLPVTINGATFSPSDQLRFTFLVAPNKTEILYKEFTNIEDNTINLEFTEQETALFTPRAYVYRLDWYQNGVFMCNIIPESTFKVVDKA